MTQAVGIALWTIGDVARALGCCKRTVERLADAGRFPRPVRVGRLRRWQAATVVAWVEGGGAVVEGGNGKA